MELSVCHYEHKNELLVMKCEMYDLQVLPLTKVFGPSLMCIYLASM